MTHTKSPSTAYQKIWDIALRIPRGKVATYGQISRLAGLPSQARLVGYALHNLPPGLPVPWHRVINSRGMISLPKRNRHHTLQKKLLESEGVLFQSERIDLTLYGWTK